VTKGEGLVIMAIGASLIANNVAQAAVTNDAQLPLWVTIVGVIGMPFATLAGVIFTFMRLNHKVENVEGAVGTKVDNLEIKINSKMDKLLELTEIAAIAKGDKAGYERGMQDSKDQTQLDTTQHQVREGLRAEGAAQLLKEQQTPAAIHPESDTGTGTGSMTHEHGHGEHTHENQK
jgi:hypothetical protein